MQSRGIAEAEIDPRLEVLITADVVGKTSKTKTDLVLWRRDDGHKSRQGKDPTRLIRERLDMRRTDIQIEVKDQLSDDCYKIEMNGAVENMSDAGRSTRGQITRYVDEQLVYQQRCHLFQIVIIREYARIIRWDRSGAIVSERFDYVADPKALLEVIWLYYGMDDAHRGLDPTAKPASPRTRQIYIQAIEALRRSGSATLKYLDDRRVPLKDQTMHTVKFDDGTVYAIAHPFWRQFGVHGRGTRVYLALNISTRELSVVKDTWTPIDSPDLSEVDTYAKLENVSGILRPLRGGRVKWKDQPQRTVTATWAKVRESWRYPCSSDFRIMEHERLAQDIAHPLDCLQSSKQLVYIMSGIVQSKCHVVVFLKSCSRATG